MKRVQVFCDDPWHPAATVRQGLEPLRAQGFDFEFSEDASIPESADLNGFSAVILAKANLRPSQNLQPWLSAPDDKCFVEFVLRGGGLLALHAGISRYENLPAMNTLLGGSFVRHPEQCAVTIVPAAGHFLADSVKSFSVHDEHYFVKLDCKNAEVFLRSTSDHGEQPAGWVQKAGRGRVGVLTPGHNLEVWQHPGFQKLLLNTLRWTTELN